MNYIGAENWLSKASSSLLESIEFALCIDSIGSSNILNLYVSRPPKTEELKHIYTTFEQVSKNYDVTFEIIHKKIQIGKEELDFEHERFSYNHIASGTITNDKVNEDDNDKITSIFDKVINTDIYINNIRFITDSLIHILYPLNKEISILSDQFNISEININQLLKFYNNSDHSILLINKDNLLVKGFNKEFEDNSNEMSIVISELKTEYTFYSIQKYQFSIMTVKGPLMELFLFFVVVAYLFIMKVIIDFIYKLKAE